MGEPQTPHFYDFGTFEHVLSSQNQLFSSLETPGSLTKIRKIPSIYKKYSFWKFQHAGTLKCCQFSKRRAPTNEEDPSKKSKKSWMWNQYLPESRKWQFGIFLKRQHQETNKLWNQETKTLWNFETKKPRNVVTRQPATQNKETNKNKTPKNHWNVIIDLGSFIKFIDYQLN